jgi:hypothetical protein
LAFRLFEPILFRMNDPSPLKSEFETAEQAESYLSWLRAKVAASRADGRPGVEHDDAMKQVRAIIEAKARDD